MNEDEDFGADTKVLLQRIARELTTIRTLVASAVNFARDAEREIPEYMRRFMNYAHDMHDIGYMYEDLGHQKPEHVRQECERIDDRMRQLLDKLHTDGGAFEKVRREMAADPRNRWDHTRALMKPKENGSETGTS